MALTAVQQAEYARNGYVVVENLVTPAELAELRRRIDEIQEGRASAARDLGAVFESGGGAAIAARPVLRKLTQKIQAARIAQSNDEIKNSLKAYDDALRAKPTV